MANNNPNQGIDDGTLAMYQLQDKFAKNQKKIVGIIIAIVVAVGGYFGYKYMSSSSNEKANAALFSAQRWFEVDSFNYVLNGDGQHAGALTIAKKYSGSPAGNLAEYYAGMSLLKTGKFQEAINHLTKFDGKGTDFEYLAYGATGDAYMELKNVGKGLEFYKKAAEDDKSAYVAPLYLFRAGLASEQNGKVEDAKKYYSEIRTKYPQSLQARDIDKYLARVGVLNNDDLMQ